MTVTISSEIPTGTGLFHDIPEASYLTDQTSLSSSGAKRLATATPAEFRWDQLNQRKPKPEFDFGSLVHKMVLGAGSEIVTIDADDYRTKAAREQRDQAYIDHKVPVLEKQWRKAERMVEALHLHETAHELLKVGSAEVSMYWVDPATGVRCRGRIDWLRPHVAIDYKTSADASPRAFTKSVHSFGYHQQDAWYLDGLRAVGHPVDDFLFIVQSVEAPYLVSVNRLSPEAIAYGRELNSRALATYKECKALGMWPGHGERIHTLNLPAWAYRDLEPQE